MAIGDLIGAMSAFMGGCKKRISQATRGSPPKLGDDSRRRRRRRRKAGSSRGGAASRFLGRAAGFVPFLGGSRRGDDGRESEKKESKVGEELDEADDVWRRTILMGEKCRPLDFAGVIHYDAAGRQVSEYPTPRSTPLRTPMMTPSRSHLPFDKEEEDRAAGR